jgi:hypothetical protein
MEEETKFGLSMYLMGTATGILIGAFTVYVMLKDNLVF